MAAELEVITNPGTPEKSAGDVVTSFADGLLSVIGRAVADPSIDIDRLERLLDRAKEIRDERRLEDFNIALSACQSEIPKVIKNRRNDHTKSLYATLDAVNDAVMPVITKHGFSVSFSTVPSSERGFVTIICELSRNGYTRTYRDDWPLDGEGSQGRANKTPIQARASSITYGKRYVLCDVFNISVGEDQDGNNAKNGGEAISPEDVETLREKLKAVSGNEDAFCKRYRVERLEDLPLRLLAQAERDIQNKAKMNAEAR